MDHVATIVADTHATKPEALGIIALTLDAAVQGAQTAHAFVALPHGGRVEVDIPKFGEAPPLAIDVYDPRGAAEARAAAQSLLDLLAASTGWPLHHLHD
ncbi:hypothetical protein BJQ94_07445 [Cryobacterium sp. SO2]|uniref:hypothetical protein n=1 Tax=Cryobacterium sp. SO2 TaxID=1897060 RepID=UPI00223E7FC4|nr:hypothetical protein [Cryobacterium sp. SO2]WEO78858.1 hypothetical protein BJQ94_07445 [Cryobacterium sp. SO2]